MSVTVTGSGYINSNPHVRFALSGDFTGSQVFEDAVTAQLAAGVWPTPAGALKGTWSSSGAASLLLAHATDPFQGAGDAGYSEGFTPGTGYEVFFIRIRNTHASAYLKVEMGATNGFPLFDAAGEGAKVYAGGHMDFSNPAGWGAIESGVSDLLTLTPETGTVTAVITVFYKAV